MRQSATLRVGKELRNGNNVVLILGWIILDGYAESEIVEVALADQTRNISRIGLTRRPLCGDVDLPADIGCIERFEDGWAFKRRAVKRRVRSALVNITLGSRRNEIFPVWRRSRRECRDQW